MLGISFFISSYMPDSLRALESTEGRADTCHSKFDGVSSGYTSGGQAASSPTYKCKPRLSDPQS